MKNLGRATFANQAGHQGSVGHIADNGSGVARNGRHAESALLAEAGQVMAVLAAGSKNQDFHW